MQNIANKTLPPVIALLLIVAIVIPIVSGFTEEQETTFENGPSNYAATLAGGDASLIITKEADENVLIDGAVNTYPDFCILASEFATIEYFSTNKVCRVWYYDGTSPTSNVINGVTELDLQIANNTISGTVNTTTVSINYGSWIAYPDANGDHMIKSQNSSYEIYLNDISQFKSVGSYSIDAQYFISVNGEIATNLGSPVDIDYPSQNVNGYVNLIKMDQHEIIVDGTENVLSFVVPLKVSALTESDNMTFTLIGIIPVVLIVSVIVAVASTVVSKKE